MRIIKFRGIDLNTNKWIYGYLSWFESPEKGLFINGKPVIPETIGQFTGLYDINGKEIYENDIVYYDELYYKEYLIKFYNSKFIVTPLKPDEPLKDPYEDSYSLSTFTHHSKTTETNLKLIGNIHENK